MDHIITASLTHIRSSPNTCLALGFEKCYFPSLLATQKHRNGCVNGGMLVPNHSVEISHGVFLDFFWGINSKF